MQDVLLQVELGLAVQEALCHNRLPSMLHSRPANNIEGDGLHG